MFSLPVAWFRPVLGWLGELASDGVLIRMNEHVVRMQLVGMSTTVIADVTVPRGACNEWAVPADPEVVHTLPLRALKIVTAGAGELLRLRLPCVATPDHFGVQLCAATGIVITDARVTALELRGEWLPVDEQPMDAVASVTLQTSELRGFVSRARALELKSVRVGVLDAMQAAPAAGVAPTTLELRAESTGNSTVSTYRTLFTSVDDAQLFSGELADDDGGGDGRPLPAPKRRRAVPRLANSVLGLSVTERFQPVSFGVVVVDKLLGCASFCTTTQLSVIDNVDSGMRVIRLRFDVDAVPSLQICVYVALTIEGVADDDD
jgi:hypothetical protein